MKNLKCFDERFPIIADFVQFTLPKVYDESITLSQAVYNLRAIIIAMGKNFNELACEWDNFQDDIMEFVKDQLGQQLVDWLNDGTLQAIIDKIIGEMELDDTYVSNVSDEIFTYGYNQYMKEVDKFKCKYKDKLTFTSLGKSYLDRDIPVIMMGNDTSRARALIIGQQHAREYSTTQLIMKQIERYCENWDNYYQGEKIKDIFETSCIYFIPMTNPDGAELVINGLSSIPKSTIDYNNLINNVKSAVEFKFRNNIAKGDIPPNWDMYDLIQWNGTKGTIPNYAFREQDLFIWKTNLEGIDLHYNCWEDGVNRELEQSLIDSGFHTQGEFRSENEIGKIGFGAKENIGLKRLLEDRKLHLYTISYHNKSPIIQWNLDLKGRHLNRVMNCARELSELTRTRYSTGRVNRSAGFSSYMYSYVDKYYGEDTYSEDSKNMSISLVFETGWQRKLPFNENNWDNKWENETQISPLPNEQAPFIFECYKDASLLFLKKYVRYQDKYNKYPEINIYDMMPRQHTAIFNALNEDNTIDGNQFGGAYSTRNCTVQRIGNRVFMDIDLLLSNIGKLDLTSDKRLVLRPLNIPSASTGGAIQYLSGAIRVTNYKSPLGDKSNLQLYAYINRGENFIRFMCYNPETNGASPFRVKDISLNFRVQFQISYLIDLNIG